MNTPDLSKSFPRYLDYEPAVPAYCLTPNTGAVIHRFFDTSPISPSGRYLAVIKFPCEDRTPVPGDIAEIILIDLESGNERVIAETRGWDTQLGAQVQWGSTDNYLYYNDINTNNWKPVGVKLDINSLTSIQLSGTIYHVSPDGTKSVSPCLLRTARTQRGYGVMAPPEFVPENIGAPDDDGLYITDLDAGQSRLLVSLNQIVNSCPQLQNKNYQNGSFYCFHAKWNPQGDRLMLIVRWVPKKNILRKVFQKNRKLAAGKKNMLKHVITMASDGSDIQIAVSAKNWAKGGHHPNWCPDGQHVMMNLNAYGDGLRFVKFRYDGGPIEAIGESTGSGHPSLHPSGRFLLTDAYPKEPISYGDGTVPIRLIDLSSGKEHVLARIGALADYTGSNREMRVDAHPAWDSTGTIAIFNGFSCGTRKVFAADTSPITLN